MLSADASKWLTAIAIGIAQLLLTRIYIVFAKSCHLTMKTLSVLVKPVSTVAAVRIEIPVKHLRWSFYLLTIFAKSSILDVWPDSEYASEQLLKSYSLSKLGEHSCITFWKSLNLKVTMVSIAMNWIWTLTSQGLPEKHMLRTRPFFVQ